MRSSTQYSGFCYPFLYYKNKHSADCLDICVIFKGYRDQVSKNLGSTTQFHRYWITLRPTQILVNHVTLFLLKNFSDIVRLEICRKYLNIGNFRWFVCFNTRPDYCRHCRQLDARLLVSGQALQHFMLFHPLLQKQKVNCLF